MLNLANVDIASLATTAPWPAVLAADAVSALEDLATFLDTDALHRVDGIDGVPADGVPADCVLADGAHAHPPSGAILPPPPPPPPAPTSLNPYTDFGDPMSPAPTPPRTTTDSARQGYDACSPALAPTGHLVHLFRANPSQVLAGIDSISAFTPHAPEISCCAHAREIGQLRQEKQIMLTKIQAAYRGDPAGYTLWVQESGIQLDPVMSPLPDVPLPPPAANPIRGANVMLPCPPTIPTPTDDLLFPPSSSSDSPRSPSCNPHLIFPGSSLAGATASLSRLRSVEPMDIDSESDSDDDSDASLSGMWRRRAHERPPPPFPRLNGSSSMSPCPVEAPARRGTRNEEPRLIVRIPRWRLLGRPPPPPARTPSPASSMLSSAVCFTLDPRPSLPAASSAPAPLSAPAHGADSAAPAPGPADAPTPAPSPAPSVAPAPSPTPSRTPSPPPASAPALSVLSTAPAAPAPIPATPVPAASSTTAAPATALTLRTLLMPSPLPAGAIPLPTAPAPASPPLPPALHVPPPLPPLPPLPLRAPPFRRMAVEQVVIETSSPTPVVQKSVVRDAKW
ncbi:hypothetical protein AMAG_12208 [Allomyces macrogynus ATCC 38327]|uniref:Uncharacterized protein n=1 Tax=Allomyces macrogynus (strain ATCC 38327) TaxID=578462 RepID=A0A0L0SXL2_ALLM3|nr:hypothetical protein AMAG_12208 [Allomyces macrogynus ATCC 38327]|eukprot:KNE67135.1 hypothetical protein AMAG_12208 [Allomyces macrogynus ATCC 38327]